MDPPMARPSSPLSQSVGTVFPVDSGVTCFPAVTTASLCSAPERGALQRRMAGQSLGSSPPSSTCPRPSSPPQAGRQSEPNLHRRSPRPSPTHPQRARSNLNIIVVPPVEEEEGGKEGTRVAEQRPKRHSTHSGSNKSGEEGMLVQLQQKLFEHYHAVAYGLIFVSYFLAFCEYLYLRLISLIFPEPIIYKRQCEKHMNEQASRNELHFASGMAAFLVMSSYQLVCFFLLTASSKYLEVKRTFSHVLSIEERLQHELVFAVKRTMFATLYPTFAIYLLSSSVIFCAIFYMVGLRDPIDHVGSQVIVHLFDLFVVLYFLAFPVLCVLFHPDINCRAKLSPFCWARGPNGKSSQSFSIQRGKAKGGEKETANQAGGEGTGAGAVPAAPPFKTTPARICPASTAAAPNYGSLERRGPTGQRTTEPEEEEGEDREIAAQAEMLRRRMRQRRQSRYKRLRGSDESGECQNGVEQKMRRNGRMEEEEEEGEEKEGTSHGTTEEGADGEGQPEEERAGHRPVETQFRGMEVASEEEDGFGPVRC